MNHNDACEFYDPERDKWIPATYGGRNGFHPRIPKDEGQDDDMFIVTPHGSTGLIHFLIPEFVRPATKTKRKPNNKKP